MKFFFGFILFMMASPALAQPLPGASEIIERSIAYHDPDGVWYASTHHFVMRETRPGGNNRDTELWFNYPEASFRFKHVRSAGVAEGQMDPRGCEATLDGSKEISDEHVDEFGLSCERIERWRDYYGYMHGMPMKLKDEGTILHDEVTTETLDGEALLRVKVTYTEEVGSDIWYFYFDPATFAIRASRFYHDEAANDGEYILLKGEVSDEGVTLPAELHWYMNDDSSLIAIDYVDTYTRTP